MDIMDIAEKPVCKDCGNPLPINSKGYYRGHYRLYCDECRYRRHKEAAFRCYRMNRNRTKEVVKIYQGQVMRLGMDYVQLKLAGLIRMPKQSKQIVLGNGDKYYDKSW